MSDYYTDERKGFRRRAARITLGLCVLITLCFLSGLFSDEVADRIPKVWPPFAVIFPSLAAAFGVYLKISSDESKT